MLNKMKEHISNGDIREALIIGQNLFAHTPGDKDVFSAFYSVLWSVTSSTENSEEKMRYFQQLSSALAAFSEATTIDDAAVEYIKSKEDSLKLLYGDIQECRLNEERTLVKGKVLKNDECLQAVHGIISKIAAASNKRDFDSLLQQIQQIDSDIDKDYLTDRQKKEYDSATQECSKLVDEKVRKFEHDKNSEYNLKALEAYEKVFKYFKENKVSGDHKEIIRGLFEFDTTRLFNETLTYYNHVYSYVLSKLNDEEKFVLTKAAIHCEVRGE